MVVFQEENSSSFLTTPMNSKEFAPPSALTAVRERVNARAEQGTEVQAASWPSSGLSRYCVTPEVQGTKDSSERSENI